MKLSIITVNLNNREGLKKTLESVEVQTWRDFEHIIIDGASTDGSVDVIREYEESIANSQDPTAANTSTPVAQPQTHNNNSLPSTISHLPYPMKWLSEPDTGIYNAMNKGIRMAKGEYILFLNSGDRFIDGDRLAMFFSNDFSEDVVYGNCYFDFGDHWSEVIGADEVTLRSFIEGTILHSGNAFIRRDAFSSWGEYDENLRIVSDWKWFLKTIGLGPATTKHIDVFISVFQMGGLSDSSNTEIERAQVLKDVVPSRLLNDYMQFHGLENQLYQQQLDIRSSYTYRIGYYLLLPIKLIMRLLKKNYES